MVRDIRILDMSLGEEVMSIVDDTKAVKNKLERSIASNKYFPEGHLIKTIRFTLIVLGNGFKWSEIDCVVGKKILVDLPKNEIIYEKFINLTK